MADRRTTKASDRLPLAIDCSNDKLRNLMTEQCRIAGGFATYYTGTREQFATSGFPERCLTPARRTKLRIAPGGDCFDAEVDAWITPGAPRMELEIHWSEEGPHGCGHPVLTEISRLTLCTAGKWFEPEDYRSREVPIGRLLEVASRGLSDYSLPPERRFQYTAEFKRRLVDLKHWLYSEIRKGEVMPMEAEPAAPVAEPPEEASLDVERLARSAIAQAKGAA
jgi:hypothetical protein